MQPRSSMCVCVALMMTVYCTCVRVIYGACRWCSEAAERTAEAVC